MCVCVHAQSCLDCRGPLTMEFFRQEYRSELPFPSPGDLPDPGMEPVSLVSQADSLSIEPRSKPSSVYTSMLLSQVVPPSPPSLPLVMSTSPFSASVSVFNIQSF